MSIRQVCPTADWKRNNKLLEHNTNISPRAIQHKWAARAAAANLDSGSLGSWLFGRAQLVLVPHSTKKFLSEWPVDRSKGLLTVWRPVEFEIWAHYGIIRPQKRTRRYGRSEEVALERSRLMKWCRRMGCIDVRKKSVVLVVGEMDDKSSVVGSAHPQPQGFDPHLTPYTFNTGISSRLCEGSCWAAYRMPETDRTSCVKWHDQHQRQFKCLETSSIPMGLCYFDCC